MRLLVVAFAGSVHTAHYLQLLEDSGWDVHLVDSQFAPSPHPALPPCTVHLHGPGEVAPGARFTLANPDPDAELRVSEPQRVEHVAQLIEELQPDVIHSHETQHGAKLVERVRRSLGRLPAPWLLTNWGSDIYWYGRALEHHDLLRSAVAACDYYGAECHRDVALARVFGLRGQVVGVWPVAGGIDLEHARDLWAPGLTSERRTIALKGVQSRWGGADLGLEAIERCGELLDGWELATYQSEPGLDEAAAGVAERTGMTHTPVSDYTTQRATHDDLLRMHGRARVSIGLNKSDGLSTSFLEALAMGALPLQSHSSCGYEVTPHGRGALFVPPTDVDQITAALRRALTDDALVDAAAASNRRRADEFLDRRRTRARVLDMYERILAHHQPLGAAA